jgi:predicted DNA-binding transcriptional regulator
MYAINVGIDKNRKDHMNLGGEPSLSRDQAVGGAILLVCALIGIFYVVTLFYPQWLNAFGMQVTQSNVQFWIIATPVLVAFVAILGIGGWIGWTMATTPPPKPIEDIPTPEETKEAENKEPAKP